jgi:RNA polymerase sigma-70 factor (ECF subfamily)
MSVDSSATSRPASSTDSARTVTGLLEVFGAERGRMLGYARHLLGAGCDDAEDVVQEIMRKTCRRPPVLRDSGALRSYVYAAIHHESTTWGQRAAAERRRRSEDELSLTRVVDVESDFDERIVHNLVVARALARLSPREREMIELVDVRRHTLKEAAAMLGIALGTAKSYHHAARRRLRADPDLAELDR